MGALRLNLPLGWGIIKDGFQIHWNIGILEYSHIHCLFMIYYLLIQYNRGKLRRNP